MPLLLKLWIHLKIQPFFINKTPSPCVHSWFICFNLCIEVQLTTKCVIKFSPLLFISSRVCCVLESSLNDISNKSLGNDFEIWSCCFIICPFLLFLYFIPLTHLFPLLLCGYYPDHIFNFFLFSIFFLFINILTEKKDASACNFMWHLLFDVDYFSLLGLGWWWYLLLDSYFPLMAWVDL